MRITSLFIKNFKGIDEQGVRIDFAPITMLFGPNNAGKSTVIQALHLAREVLYNNNQDADHVEGGGDSINLGGFKEFVHKHDLDRNVVIGIGIDLEGEDLPMFRNNEEALWKELQTYYQETIKPENTYLEELWLSVQRVLNRIENLELQFTISWGKAQGKPFISEYAVDCGDVAVAAIQCEENGLPTFSGLDYSGLMSSEEKEQFKGAIQTWLNDRTVWDDGQLDFMDQLGDIINNGTTWESIYPGSTDRKSVRPYGTKIINPQNRGCALPPWDSSLDLSEVCNSEILCTKFLSSLLIGPGLLLRDFFQRRLQYIGPLRQIPPRNFLAVKTPVPDRWANGLAAWDMLATASNAQLDAVNAWLHGPQSLNTGYTLRFQNLLPVREDTARLNTILMALWEDADDGAASLLREILNQPLEKRLALCNEQSGVMVSPSDVGTGFSQIIPVVVAAALAKPDMTIAIEQPELHIHPAWQTALGDLFLNAITKERAPMFLLETHSEHLMLRLLRRVRETNDDELPSDHPQIKPEMISVLYVQAKEGGGTEITRLPITSDGDFSRKWPNGFFAERAEELF